MHASLLSCCKTFHHSKKKPPFHRFNARPRTPSLCLCLNWLNTIPVEACSKCSMLASSLSICLRSTHVVALSSTLFLLQPSSIPYRVDQCCVFTLIPDTVLPHHIYILSLIRLFKNDHMIRIVTLKMNSQSLVSSKFPGFIIFVVFQICC